MKVLFVGGGTGGHIYPNLAVARRLREVRSDALIRFVGQHGREEEKVMPREGFPLDFIPSARLPNRTDRFPSWISFVRTNLAGLAASWELIRDFKPDVLFGTGGYESFSPFIAARLRGIPTILQEQNVLPGRTNRLLARFAQVFASAFPEAERYVRHPRFEVTGNPVRPEFLCEDPVAAKQAAREKLNIPEGTQVVTVMGGSQGARSINEAVVQLLHEWHPQPPTWLIHLTGEKGFEQVVSALSDLALLDRTREGVRTTLPPQLQYWGLPYTHEIYDFLWASDLVVSRAGATAISEFLVLGLPSILIPYPYAAEDHQRFNAKVLVDAGAAVMISDGKQGDPKELQQGKLTEVLPSLLADSEKRRALSERARSLAKPHATDHLVNLLIEVVR